MQTIYDIAHLSYVENCVVWTDSFLRPTTIVHTTRESMLFLDNEKRNSETSAL